MICKNCGVEQQDFNQICTNCGAYLHMENANNFSKTEIKTTWELVFSIIELVCLNPLFGLISLILYFAKLRPEINNGNIEEAQNTKKTILTLLIVGAVIGVLLPLVLIMLVAIPNFSGIENRMEVRADKTTAAHIGKAVRIWYTEYSSDPEFMDEIGTVVGSGETETSQGCLPENGEKMIPIDYVKKLDEYMNTNLTPSSLKDNSRKYDDEQQYYVGVITGEYDEKIVVCIANEPPMLPEEFDYYVPSYTGDYHFDNDFEDSLAYIEE